MKPPDPPSPTTPSLPQALRLLKQQRNATASHEQADGQNNYRKIRRWLHTWEMSITESQLRGRAEVKSLKPSRVDMIPFWSMRRIMVPSTKKITPYLSTVMPGWEREDGWRGMNLCWEDYDFQPILGYKLCKINFTKLVNIMYGSCFK